MVFELVQSLCLRCAMDSLPIFTKIKNANFPPQTRNLRQLSCCCCCCFFLCQSPHFKYKVLCLSDCSTQHTLCDCNANAKWKMISSSVTDTIYSFNTTFAFSNDTNMYLKIISEWKFQFSFVYFFFISFHNTEIRK